MQCPICKKLIEAADESARRYAPFCSDRCKLIDLGRWLRGTYQIPVQEESEADSDDVTQDISS